jgi:hypothetical protein
MNLFWRLLLAIEMIFWHNLQIKITTETEDTLRTDSTNFILDYLSESSRHEANILSKWVWMFSPYSPYTATWYNTPVSCSQIAMSPQNFCPKTKKYITDMCSCYTIAWLCKLQKGCTQLEAASDKVYQLLAHGWRFSLGTPASSTTKTGLVGDNYTFLY